MTFQLLQNKILLNIIILNKRDPNINFTIEKQINYFIAFLDVFISGINNKNLTLQTYHKSTYTGRLLNFKSFTSFSYKISLFKCLIHRSFKICNNWKSFHNDIENINSNLMKNAYLPFLINKVIKKYVDYKFSSNQTQLKDKSDVHYFELPYIGNLSHHIKNKLSKESVKKILTLSMFLFHLSQFINLLVLAVVLVVLAKLVVILKKGLRSISKRIASLIF